MRIVLVGSGISCLLFAALARKEGHDVTVFERLSIPGGRFTNLEFRGFKLSTGAFHTIPNFNGPFRSLLNHLGARVEIVKCDPRGLYLLSGKTYGDWSILKALSLKEKAFLLKMFLLFRKGLRGKISLEEWLEQEGASERIKGVVESVLGFTCSIPPSHISIEEASQVFRNLKKYGPPGVIVGGCKSVVDELIRLVHPGNVRLNEEVRRISFEPLGVETSLDFYEADVVISGIGPKETLKLCKKAELPNEFVKRVRKIREARGVKFTLSLSEPFVKSPSIVFTPEHIFDGFNQPSLASSDLAPEGKVMAMVHQTLRTRKIEGEVEKGKEELEDLFKDFELLHVQVYHGEWPVNRAIQGQDLEPFTPIEGFYLLGDGVKARGFVEVEGIAANTIRLAHALGLARDLEWG